MLTIASCALQAAAAERARRLAQAATPDGQRHQIKLGAAREAHRQAARHAPLRALVNTLDLSPDQAEAAVPEHALPGQPIPVDGLTFRAAANASEHALVLRVTPDGPSREVWVHVMDLEHLGRVLLQRGHALPLPDHT